MPSSAEGKYWAAVGKIKAKQAKRNRWANAFGLASWTAGWMKENVEDWEEYEEGLKLGEQAGVDWMSDAEAPKGWWGGIKKAFTSPGGEVEGTTKTKDKDFMGPTAPTTYSRKAIAKMGKLRGGLTGEKYGDWYDILYPKDKQYDLSNISKALDNQEEVSDDRPIKSSTTLPNILNVLQADPEKKMDMSRLIHGIEEVLPTGTETTPGDVPKFGSAQTQLTAPKFGSSAIDIGKSSTAQQNKVIASLQKLQSFVDTKIPLKPSGFDITTLEGYDPDYIPGDVPGVYQTPKIETTTSASDTTYTLQELDKTKDATINKSGIIQTGTAHTEQWTDTKRQKFNTDLINLTNEKINKGIPRFRAGAEARMELLSNELEYRADTESMSFHVEEFLANADEATRNEYYEKKRELTIKYEGEGMNPNDAEMEALGDLADIYGKWTSTYK